MRRWYLRSRSLGIVEEKANPKTLLADYDMGGRAPRFVKLCSTLRLLGLRVSWIRYDRTRNGYHVIVRHNVALTPAETVCAQFAIRSDRKRETLNATRVIWAVRTNPPRFWKNRWNLLFSSKLRG